MTPKAIFYVFYLEGQPRGFSCLSVLQKSSAEGQPIVGGLLEGLSLHKIVCRDSVCMKWTMTSLESIESKTPGAFHVRPLF